MTPDVLFIVANSVAMNGWILLVFLGRKRWAQLVVRWLVLALAAFYALVLATHWGEAKGGFDTLENVAALFANRWVLLGGWVHYLAFDLFIGSWEARDAAERGISHWMVAPCLLLTFLFGPAGLLLYFGIRLAVRPAPRTASSTSATS